MLKRDELNPLQVGKRRFGGEPGLSFRPRPFGQIGDFAGHGIMRTAMFYRYATLSGATGNIHFNQAIETPPFLPISGSV